jgi:hypothetical protein
MVKKGAAWFCSLFRFTVTQRLPFPSRTLSFSLFIFRCSLLSKRKTELLFLFHCHTRGEITKNRKRQKHKTQKGAKRGSATVNNNKHLEHNMSHTYTPTPTPCKAAKKKKKVKERSHASLDVLLHFYFLLLRLYTVNEPQSTKLPVRVTASRLPASLLRGCRPPRAVSLAAAGGDAELPALHRRPSRYR